MILLQTVDLRKQFGETRACDNVNFTVNKGEFLSLIGSNGAGKTSLVNLISAHLTPDSGQILFEGNDITFTTVYERIKAGIARSFQIVNLFDGLSVFDNVAMSIFSRDGKAVKIAALAEHDQDVRNETFDVLGQFGLKSMSAVLAGGLAQGERKLLDVAVAYALRPKLLFLDEPTTGLDPVSRRQLWELISKFQAEGKTIVLTTHYMEEAERLCDRVAIVDHGRIIALGTPQELIDKVDVSHLPPPEPRKTSATLEDVFVSLTGRTLRDE